MRGYRLRYNGMALRQYCLKNGIGYVGVMQKIRKGYPIEEALKFQKYGRKIKYHYHGKTISDIALSKGVSKACLYRYAKETGNLEMAIDLCSSKKQTLAEYCRKNDLPYNRVYNLYKIRGYKLEKVLEMVKRSYHRTKRNAIIKRTPD